MNLAPVPVFQKFAMIIKVMQLRNTILTVKNYNLTDVPLLNFYLKKKQTINKTQTILKLPNNYRQYPRQWGICILEI